MEEQKHRTIDCISSISIFQTYSWFTTTGIEKFLARSAYCFLWYFCCFTQRNTDTAINKDMIAPKISTAAPQIMFINKPVRILSSRNSSKVCPKVVISTCNKIFLCQQSTVVCFRETMMVERRLRSFGDWISPSFPWIHLWVPFESCNLFLRNKLHKNPSIQFFYRKSKLMSRSELKRATNFVKRSLFHKINTCVHLCEHICCLFVWNTRSITG